jgi:fructokinase
MIICCGEALIDMVPSGKGGNSFLARTGGSPYNTAIAAARLGSRTRFLGRMGTDFLADSLFDKLADNGVDTGLVIRRDQPTTLAFVQRTASGDARYAFYSNGAADRSFAATDLPANLGMGARFLMTGSISLLQEPIGTSIEALIARESASILVSIDPNVRPSLVVDRLPYIERLLRCVSKAAIVKASSEDLEWLFPELAPEYRYKPFLDAGTELVVETRGAEGAIARTRKLEVHAKAFAVTVADTIGAGDTFHAAFLYCLDEAGIATRHELADLDEASLARFLMFSQAAAALDCEKVGAEPPILAEVKRFLEASK